MSAINWTLTNCQCFGKYFDKDFSEFPIGQTVTVFVFPNNGFSADGNASCTANGTDVPFGKNSLGTGYNSLQITRTSETQVRLGSSAVYTFDIDGLELDITVNCAKDSSLIPIVPTLNFDGCELAPFSQTKAYDNGLLFVTPKKGHSFETLPSAVRNGSVNINGSRFQAQSFEEEVVRILIGTPLAFIEVNGTAVRTAPDTEIEIENNLTNASADGYVLDFTKSNTYTISAESGFDFDTPPFLRVEAEELVELPFALADGVYTLTVDGTLFEGATGASFNGTAKKITRTLPITLDSDYCEFTESSATAINETDSTYYVEVRAKGGYMFAKPPTISAWYDGVGGVQKATRNMSAVSGKLNTYYYELSIYLFGDNDPEHFFSANDEKGTPAVSTDIIVETTLLSDFGAIRAYKTSKVINQDVFNKRFYNLGADDYEDLGKYIIGFYRYPFDIPTLGETSVRFGWFDTEINAPLVENGVYSFSLGKHLLQGLYGNSSDIDTTTITLVLPYIGIVGVDSRFVNTEIEVIYRVDVLTNSCIVEIYSNDMLIDTVDTVIGYSIPYILKTDELTPNVKLSSSLLQSYNPRAILKQKKRIQGIPYKTSVMRSLADIVGYVKCGIVRLKTSEQMTTEEQEKILSLLKDGVVI